MDCDHIANIKLVLGILNRAALDAVSTVSYMGKERREAIWWITDWFDYGPIEPWSFPWVCEHLDLCPHKTRDSILSFKGTPYEKKPRKQYVYQMSKGYGIGRAAENLFDITREPIEYIEFHLGPHLR